MAPTDDLNVISYNVTPSGTLPPLPLSDGIKSEYIDCTVDVGLTFHVLSCGSPDTKNPSQRPLILLLHGFPELAFSWRKVMPTLASAGNYVVAPDLRGYGRTTGWEDYAVDYHSAEDLHTFRMSQYVMDMLHLVKALGYSSVRCLVGHDAGSAIAAQCALVRPAMFHTLVLMSHPFKGNSSRSQSGRSREPARDPNIVSSLAALVPPRKPYKWYNAEPSAADDWENPGQGMAAFLRGYYHLKSAAWKRNDPHPLKSWTAKEVAKLPGYYCMPLHLTMPETVEQDMDGEDAAATKIWLSDADLSVLIQEWERTGFQGGLNFYRVATGQGQSDDINGLFVDATLRVPCTFISGDKDWGNWQDPGALENMQQVCEYFQGFRKVTDAGHWPQQEQPGAVAMYILQFMWKQAQGYRHTFDPITVHSAAPSDAAQKQKASLQQSEQRKKQIYGSHADAAGVVQVPSDPPRRDPTNETSRTQPEAKDAKSKRADTPIDATSVYSFKSRGGPALAVDSSSRNAEVYRQITEAPQRFPKRQPTPFDDMDTELMSDG